MSDLILPLGHAFVGVDGNEDDECFYRAPGDPSYCTEPAEEHEPREPIYCPAQTFRQTRYEPAEYCENQVPNEGDLCSKHEEYDPYDD